MFTYKHLIFNTVIVKMVVAYLGYSSSPHLLQKFCTHLCWTFGDNYPSLKRNETPGNQTPSLPATGFA